MSMEELLALGVLLGILLVAVATVLLYVRRAYLVPRARNEMRACVLEALAAAARRGLPLGPALAAAAEDHRWARGRALARVRDAHDAGKPLSDALGHAGSAWFPRHVVAAVRAGEESGDLAGALSAAARESVDALSLAHALHLALVYPIIVFLGLAFTRAFIYDKFLAIFEGLNVGLPWVFFAAEAAGTFALYAGLALLLGTIVLPMLGWWAVYGHLAERARDLLARLPVARAFAELRGGERALLSLAAGVRAGAPLGAALRRAAPAAGYSSIAASLEAAAAAADGGAPPDEALARARLPRWARTRAGAALSGANERAAAALEAIAEECGRRRRDAVARAGDLAYPVMVLALAVPIALMYASNFAVLELLRKGVETRPW
jgi:type II secretory pathway component PulF